MFVVRIMGGLGNQMFQYGFAKYLQKQGFEVFLENSFFDQKTGFALEGLKIRLELVNFDIKIPFLENFDKEIFYKKTDLYFYPYKILKNFIPKKYRRHKYRFYYTDENFKMPKNLKHAYFEGYFQKYDFIKELLNDLEKDFILKNALSAQNQSTKAYIQSLNDSCFLHIRRGDYLQEQNWEAVRLGSAYFNSALRLIKNKLKYAHIFIFSNDIKWAKENFLKNLDKDLFLNMDFNFIENNDEDNACEEMELMRTCKNGIISNSTFSTWAALLIQNQEKIIIAPQSFSYNPKNQNYTNELLPNDWQRIDYVWGELL